MLTGFYLPGQSVLHTSRPTVKLLALFVLTTLMLLYRGPVALTASAVVVLLGYLVARIPRRAAVAQIWPLRWWVVFLLPVQAWSQGWLASVVFVGTLVVAVAAAGLVTVTTRVSELLGAVETALGPLRRFGVDPERVGLLFALAMRSIPVIADSFRLSREAQAARGLERSLRAVLTPFVVRSVRHAERVGEALAARGIDD